MRALGRARAGCARGCLGAGSIEKAANVVRAAYRLNPAGLVMPHRAPGVEVFL